jgi:hypothetical protein
MKLCGHVILAPLMPVTEDYLLGCDVWSRDTCSCKVGDYEDYLLGCDVWSRDTCSSNTGDYEDCYLLGCDVWSRDTCSCNVGDYEGYHLGCDVWSRDTCSSNSGDYEDCYLLGCDVWSCVYICYSENLSACGADDLQFRQSRSVSSRYSVQPILQQYSKFMYSLVLWNSVFIAMWGNIRPCTYADTCNLVSYFGNSPAGDRECFYPKSRFKIDARRFIMSRAVTQ